MELAIMIEGQMGLNWPRWKRLVRAVEDLGFAGLYRSDHFTNPGKPDEDSLELWLSLTWLADNTRRIEFGPMVTPVSFRDPVFSARMAIQVDNLSQGRLRLGVGAGWQEREHEAFGYQLLGVTDRFDRFQEGLEVITRLINSDVPVSFDGKYYRLKEALLLPRPVHPESPAIVIGGNGPKLTLPLVAHYAVEWNGVFINPDRYADLTSQLDLLLKKEGRQPEDVKRTLMTNLVFGADEAALKRKLNGREPEKLTADGILVGPAARLVADLGRFSEAGVQRVMLQWLDLDDIDGLEALATQVMPQV
jgi:F420-dependent oxidoreductase-like protein